jgi:putative flippase GtrA
MGADTASAPALTPKPAREPMLRRLLSRHTAILLVRNTVISCVAFGFGLGALWLLVERFAVDKVVAAALSFVLANSLHYAFGRTWIYRGTDRAVASGYVYFIANGLIGLAITTALFWALLRWTSIDYLVARIVVSIFAGLAMFLLNATLNFKRV